MVTAKSGMTLSGDQQDQQLNTLDYKKKKKKIGTRNCLSHSVQETQTFDGSDVACIASTIASAVNWVRKRITSC